MDDPKGHILLKFHGQSQHWPKGRMKIEKIPSFYMEIKKGYCIFSFDIKRGYWHFFLHMDIRDVFLYHYYGQYFRCIKLPMG